MKANFNVSAKEVVEIEGDICEVKKFKDLKISQTFQTESELIEVKTEAFHLNNNEDIKFLNEKNIEFNKVKSGNCIISDISTQSPTEEKTSKRTQTNLKDLENQSLKRIAPTQNFSSNVLQTSCLVRKKNFLNKKFKSVGSKLKTRFEPKFKKSKYYFDLNKIIEELFATPMDDYDEKEAQRILDEERAVRRRRFLKHYKWLRDNDEWEETVDKVLAPFDITTYFSKYKPSSSEEFEASSSKSLESFSPKKSEPCSSKEFQSGTTKKFKPSSSNESKPNTSKEPQPSSSKALKSSSFNAPKPHTSKEFEDSSSMEFESSSTMEPGPSFSMDFESSSTMEPGPSSSMEFESYSSMEPKPGCSKDYF